MNAAAIAMTAFAIIIAIGATAYVTHKYDMERASVGAKPPAATGGSRQSTGLGSGHHTP